MQEGKNKNKKTNKQPQKNDTQQHTIRHIKTSPGGGGGQPQGKPTGHNAKVRKQPLVSSAAPLLSHSDGWLIQLW